MVKKIRTKVKVGAMSAAINQLNKRVSALEEGLNAVGKMAGSLNHNVLVLSRHADQKNSHFSVVSRVFIRHVKALKEALRSEEGGLDIPDVDYDSMNKEFDLFDAFSKSENFKSKLREWFMGEDVDKLISEPSSEEELGETTETDGDAQGEYPENATVFGGDYAADSKKTDPEEAQGCDVVPEVQSEDHPADRPEDQEGSPGVPTVP